MSDPFEAYGHRATSVAVPRLVGVLRTRSDARAFYGEAIVELEACEDADMLAGYLASIAPQIAQFQAELDLLWEGDGDFPGLRIEIARAHERVGSSFRGTGNRRSHECGHHQQEGNDK